MLSESVKLNYMQSSLATLFLAMILSAIMYPLWISVVYKFRMRESIRESGPKTHLKKTGTPTMGGVVFLLVTAVVTLLLNLSKEQTVLPLFVALLAGLFGFMEDFTKVYKTSMLPKIFRRENIISKFVNNFGSRSEQGALDSYQKIIIQSLIGSFVAYWTYLKLGWDYVWLPIIGNVHIGIFYPIFVFCLFMMVLNFIAFSDGLDGLLGGLSTIILVGFWAICSQLGYNTLAKYCATVIGALVPFLYFNVNPARVFMGNVGSHVIGATLAILAVVLHREVAFLILAAVPLLDGLTSPLQSFSKSFLGKRIFLMAPVHHHFELLGWSESKVVFRFWVVELVFVFIGVFVALL